MAVVYCKYNLPKGHILKSNDIKRIRPGYGLDPKYFYKIIGKRLTRNVKEAEAVSWDSIESFEKKV